MNEVAKYAMLTCFGVFMACAVATIALIPFVLAKGLKAYPKTKEIKDMLAGDAEAPWVLSALLVIRRIQTWAWIGALLIGLGAIAWAVVAELSK